MVKRSYSRKRKRSTRSYSRKRKRPTRSYSRKRKRSTRSYSRKRKRSTPSYSRKRGIVKGENPFWVDLCCKYCGGCPCTCNGPITTDTIA